MATINYYAKENYFSFLSGSPKAWQLIFAQDVEVNRGDTVKVIEVDVNDNPTGNELTGIVEYTSTNNTFTYNDKSKLTHIIPN